VDAANEMPDGESSVKCESPETLQIELAGEMRGFMS
jgi:hypothetical protein